MKSKTEKEFNRVELADYLEKIARHLRSGKFEAEGRQWSVPENFEAMHEYRDHPANLIRAVERQQLEDVEHELRDLRARWVACHRDFK